MQQIHLLPPLVANQIAAGEVVERPASVVKELAENSLDAGASRIQIRIEKAGKRLIEVEDDGCGMSPVDARMALQRHATSKISQVEDLHAIASHGFRGEALPSIASVSRFRMHTACAGSDEGCEVTVNQLGETECRPASWRQGSRVEVRDLFLHTPARLRFMRTDKTEEAAILEVVRQLAIAHPAVHWQLWLDGRLRLDVVAGTRQARLAAIMGKDFPQNTVAQRLEYEGMVAEGFFGLPTFHHRDASRMLFMVNGRAIRDRELIAALRAAYRDVMFHDRYPVAVVFLEIDPADVDVNVHPAKREVRFRRPQQVRTAVVACVRAAIEQYGQHVAPETTQQAVQTAMRRNTMAPPPALLANASYTAPSGSPVSQAQEAPRQRESTNHNRPIQPPAPSSAAPRPLPAFHQEDKTSTLNLGRPLAQLHQRYILSQTADGVLLIDQHAAHERINYERIKQQLRDGEVRSQPLLLPVHWQPDAHTAAWLHEQAEELRQFGVVLRVEDDDTFAIRAIPALLQDEAPQALVEELVEACRLIGSKAEAAESGMGRVLERWLGNRACKTSLKAGQTLSPDEQQQLLRQMEQTPNIAQCNHGRPTYIRLSLNDLDRLFGRQG